MRLMFATLSSTSLSSWKLHCCQPLTYCWLSFHAGAGAVRN
jgi:hypothetical protein